MILFVYIQVLTGGFMRVRILAISVLISIQCFAAYDETDFCFNLQEVADPINIGWVHVVMHNPPIHLQELFNKDYVQDLCLTISKNKDGTYNFSYNVKTQRQTLNLKLSEADIDEEKLFGTVLAKTPLPRNFYISNMVKSIDELYHHREKKEFNMQGEKIVNIPAYSAYDKMLAYINIINQFSIPKNQLFFDEDVANQQLLKDLERNMDAYQKSLSPEELAAFLEDVARLEEEAKIQPVEQKPNPTGWRSWFSRLRSWWRGE
jgi:hypothetical protein